MSGVPPAGEKREGVGERIAKAIARAGVCSRRDAEKLIAENRVTVDGRVVDTPALLVSAANRIKVDGVTVPARAPARLWRYHKPAGLVTTHRDPEGRPTIFERLPPELGRVISIGRLDLTSEGLLLLTNDGALSRHLELPSTGWIRRYRVRAYGAADQPALDALKDGVTVDGVTYGAIDARIDRQQGGNVWLTLALGEGRNREVRRVLSHLGLAVNRLIRLSYGPFQLGALKAGQIEEVTRKVLIEQLGKSFPL
jgi:23S rRNA pseudouridine2605 synthase